MCKKRTSLLVGGLISAVLASCGGEELTNCAQVEGNYYVELEKLASLPELPDPASCDVPEQDYFDLTEDNLTTNTGTSAQTTRVDRFGCEVQVTYTVTVTNPGDPDDMSGWVLRNNSGLGGGTKYRVEDRGILRGEAVHSRFDRNGNEVCRTLFDATWLPEEVAMEMWAHEQ